MTPGPVRDKAHLPPDWTGLSAFGSIRGVSSNYRFAAPLIVRWVGVALTVAGVLVVLVTLVAVAMPRADVPGVGLVAAIALVLLLGLCGFIAVRRATVVRLDDRGYQVRHVRGAGVRQATWKEVEDVAAATVAGARCVVVRLRDGRATTIPVDVLAGSSDEFVRDLQQHLNRGHGYRPLAGPSR